jgi:hypothetical protein
MIYNQSTRNEMHGIGHRIRAGVSIPTSAVKLKPNEGGIFRISGNLDIDAISGLVMSEMRLRMRTVYVPTAALMMLDNPDDEAAGDFEALQRALSSDTPLFDFEVPNVITKSMRLKGKDVGAGGKICKSVRLAYIAAMNHLATKLYFQAEQYPAGHMEFIPSTLTNTVLQRWLAVNDPNEKINGRIDLTLPTVQMDVEGVYRNYSGSAYLDTNSNFANKDGERFLNTSKLSGDAIATDFRIMDDDGNENPMNVPHMWTELTDASVGTLSLSDFTDAKRMDKIHRMFDAMIKENPAKAQEWIELFVHGFSFDNSKLPQLLNEEIITIGNPNIGVSTSPDNLDAVQSNYKQDGSYMVQVPKSTLGGVVITIMDFLPDEVIENQPSPLFTKPYLAENIIAEEFADEPVGIKLRDIDSDSSSEVVQFYVGHNQLDRNVVNIGWDDNVNLNLLDNKHALFQYKIPLGVNPQSVYMGDVDHSIFDIYEVNGEPVPVATLMSQMIAQVSTLTQFGKPPIENYDILDNAIDPEIDVLEDA